MRIIAYARVSTGDQAENGVSLDAQVAKMNGWAAARGEKIAPADIFVEAASGTSLEKRPLFQKAIETAILCRGTLVVCKLDRFARSVVDANQQAKKLFEAGAGLAVIDTPIDTTTAHGRFTLGILALLAELEADIIRERTREALAHKRSKGEFTGNAPFGMRRDGMMLAVDEAEEATVKKIRAMRGLAMSLSAIARALNADGVKSRNGGKWSAGQVRRVLARS